MEAYGFTEKGTKTALGVMASLSDGFDLEQTAVLNGLDNAGQVRAILRMIAAYAGLVGPVTPEDTYL